MNITAFPINGHRRFVLSEFTNEQISERKGTASQMEKLPTVLFQSFPCSPYNCKNKSRNLFSCESFEFFKDCARRQASTTQLSCTTSLTSHLQCIFKKYCKSLKLNGPAPSTTFSPCKVLSASAAFVKANLTISHLF